MRAVLRSFYHSCVYDMHSPQFSRMSKLEKSNALCCEPNMKRSIQEVPRIDTYPNGAGCFCLAADVL